MTVTTEDTERTEGHGQMLAALATSSHLAWDQDEREMVVMWALVSIAESLKTIAASWDVKRVGDVPIGRTNV